MNFTHIDQEGNAVMVDVSQKDSTVRTASACGRIRMSRECYLAVEAGTAKKGDVLGTAQIAGIMGAKQTADLIPLCHRLNLSKASVSFRLRPELPGVEAVCTVKCTGQTGVEMEALTGVSIALLTIYDMCKAMDKRMVIEEIHLMEKHGGKSGDFSFTVNQEDSRTEGSHA